MTAVGTATALDELCVDTICAVDGCGAEGRLRPSGDPVGWSWLFEPYLAHFDVRSRGVTRAIRFDAAVLRRRCEEDPTELGYELIRSFASVIVERLHATRLQVLDVCGRATVA